MEENWDRDAVREGRFTDPAPPPENAPQIAPENDNAGACADPLNAQHYRDPFQHVEEEDQPDEPYRPPGDATQAELPTHLLAMFNLDTDAQDYSDEAAELANAGYYDAEGRFHYTANEDQHNEDMKFIDLMMAQQFGNPTSLQGRGRSAIGHGMARSDRHLRVNPHEDLAQGFRRLNVAEPAASDIAGEAHSGGRQPRLHRNYVRYTVRGEATFSFVTSGPSRSPVTPAAPAATARGVGRAGTYRASAAIPVPGAAGPYVARPIPRFHAPFGASGLAQQQFQQQQQLQQNQRFAFTPRAPRPRRGGRRN